jgi:hypothetical protein
MLVSVKYFKNLVHYDQLVTIFVTKTNLEKLNFLAYSPSQFLKSSDISIPAQIYSTSSFFLEDFAKSEFAGYNRVWPNISAVSNISDPRMDISDVLGS